MKHRYWNYTRARLGGYFWLPCPLCGERFGGHEDSGYLMTSASSGISVCIDCADEAEALNKERFSSTIAGTVEWVFQTHRANMLKLTKPVE